jgi:hypothetical protein
MRALAGWKGHGSSLAAARGASKTLLGVEHQIRYLRASHMPLIFNDFSYRLKMADFSHLAKIPPLVPHTVIVLKMGISLSL